MPKAIYSDEAENDIRQIAAYIARENLRAALAWTDQIRALCELLARQPGIGARVQSPRFGEIRRHAVGNYIVYYAQVDDGIEVFRVVRDAREQKWLV